MHGAVVSMLLTDAPDGAERAPEEVGQTEERLLSLTGGPEEAPAVITLCLQDAALARSAAARWETCRDELIAFIREAMSES